MRERTLSAMDSNGGTAALPQPAPGRSRTNDPLRTQADILTMAGREFADKGLAGARVDLIAEATRTSKRMIYYYFGSKEGLYLAVLEDSYRRMREIEGQLQLSAHEPLQALRELVGFTVDYQRSHPDFIRLVMSENMLRAQYLAKSEAINSLNVPAIMGLRDVLERGAAQGVLRAGLDPVQLHMSISALSVFNVANRHTFGLIFQIDFDDPAEIARRRQHVIEMIERFARAD